MEALPAAILAHRERISRRVIEFFTAIIHSLDDYLHDWIATAALGQEGTICFGPSKKARS
jgi:hypothetical protein